MGVTGVLGTRPIQRLKLRGAAPRACSTATFCMSGMVGVQSCWTVPIRKLPNVLSAIVSQLDPSIDGAAAPSALRDATQWQNARRAPTTGERSRVAPGERGEPGARHLDTQTAKQV
jgi:hypothetical protein